MLMHTCTFKYIVYIHVDIHICMWWVHIWFYITIQYLLTLCVLGLTCSTPRTYFQALAALLLL